MENKKIVKKLEIKDNIWINKMLFKKTNVDDEVAFEFHLSVLKWVGVVFAVSAVLLPFLLNIILRNVFRAGTRLDMIISFTNLVLALSGMIYVIKALTIRKFLESGAVGFYLFYCLPKIVVLIMNMSDVNGLIFRIVDLLVRIIVIVLIFVLSPTLYLRFKKTCKEDLYLIFTVIAFGFIATIGLHFALLYLDELINGKGVPLNHRANEKSLLQASNIQLVFAFLSLSITAPFVEELACRHGIFTLSGNKCLAFFLP